MRDEEFTLIGRNPVIEAFRAGKAIDRLFVQDGLHDGPISTILREAKKAGVKPEFVKKERLDEIAGQGASHQGVAAYLAAFHYSSVQEMLDAAREKNEDPFLFILDGIEDPHNLGAMIRTANLAGAHGVIIRERRAVGLTSTVAKSSAGALVHTRVAKVTNIGQTIEELKKESFIFIAGGVGAAPVYPQVKWLHEHGIEADVILGARNKDLLIMEEDLRKVAANVYVCTDDGSYGEKGVVTDILKKLVNEDGKKYTKCVAIGPVIMMKFACLTTKDLGIPTIVSMNPIMIDGTGMCGACRLIVGDKVKFACVDGPEFDGHLVDFDLAMKRQRQYKDEEGRAMLALQEGATHSGGCEADK